MVSIFDRRVKLKTFFFYLYLEMNHNYCPSAIENIQVHEFSEKRLKLHFFNPNGQTKVRFMATETNLLSRQSFSNVNEMSIQLFELC